jgi:hypothetical protein
MIAVRVKSDLYGFKQRNTIETFSKQAAFISPSPISLDSLSISAKYPKSNKYSKNWSNHEKSTHSGRRYGCQTHC